ncbi:MAG: Nif3-like dinuclear metal center hexameric protein, partial [Flavobacteriaceae bacterium]
TEVSGILVTLDTLENVVDEAIAENCNLIVSFHPIIFDTLKKLTGASYVERVVIKAIENKIAIYSMHTALDNASEGVNTTICDILGIKNRSVLIPKKKSIKKLTTYVPVDDCNTLKAALFAAGAGTIGNYSNCSFTTEGTGSYKAGASANPTKGEIGRTHYEKETQINVTYAISDEGKVLRALSKNHPYEEIAYEIITLENTDQNIGMGMIGELDRAMEGGAFLQHVKEKMKASCIRHSQILNKKIKKVAVLGGSGAYAIGAAKSAGADAFVTADVKYHQFYNAEEKLLITDIGHYETEQFTKNLLVDYLSKKIPNFAIRLSASKTNPINYL